MNIKRIILKTILVSFMATSFVACENTKETVKEITKEKTKKVKLPKPEWDSRLSAVELSAGEWYQFADDDAAAARNIGSIYLYKIKDYEKAIIWYLYADSIEINKMTYFNLALSYHKNKNFDKAILFYNKSHKLGDKFSSNNLGYLYENEFKNYEKSIKWYKESINRENTLALENIALLYHSKLNDNIKASAYLINRIAYPENIYKKEKTINYLKNKWKLSNETIRKGYELQLTMPGLPKRYKGDLGLD